MDIDYDIRPWMSVMMAESGHLSPSNPLLLHYLNTDRHWLINTSLGLNQGLLCYSFPY
jgi:hypothetical protein